MAEDDIEANTIELYPIVSWEVATLSDEGVLLRVGYLPGVPARPVIPDQARALAESISLGLGAAECEDLGIALIRAAKEAREGPGDETE